MGGRCGPETKGPRRRARSCPRGSPRTGPAACFIWRLPGFRRRGHTLHHPGAASHSLPSRGSGATEPAARMLLFAADAIIPRVLFPHGSGNTNVLVFPLLSLFLYFVLLRFKLMLLSSQMLAHPGAPEDRHLLAAGEGRNHTLACARPGFWRTGARRDGPHWQGLSHHLPVHSCRSPRSAFRHCDLHTCEDMAAASHMLGPRQGSPGTDRSESLGAPGRDQGGGEGPGCGGSQRSAGHGQRGRSYSLSRTLRPRGQGPSLVHFSAQRPASSKPATRKLLRG